MTTPIAPAPDAPLQIAPAAPAGPVKSAVAQASDAARAAIASGQAFAPAAPQAGQPAPAPIPLVPGAPVAPVAPAPAAGQPAPKPGEAPAAPGAGESAPGTETPEQIAERETAEALRVELPVGETEDDHLILTANDPETAEQLRKLVDVALEGRAMVEEVETLRATATQIEEMREYADADPVGFAMDMLGTNLQAAKNLTMYLLTQPSLYAAVKDDLARLADPTGFKLAAADAREARHTQSAEAQDRIETSRVVRQNLTDVQSTVHAMLPDSLTPAQRQVAFRDCLRDLKDFADSKELLVLPVNQIPGLLQQRLSALGIDPAEAMARATVAAARKGGSTPMSRTPARAAVPARTPPAVPVAAAPKKDGAAFVLSAQRKRDAGAIPNAGAGAPSNNGGVQAPVGADGKKLGIQDTIKWHREQRAKGVKLW